MSEYFDAFLAAYDNCSDKNRDVWSINITSTLSIHLFVLIDWFLVLNSTFINIKQRSIKHTHKTKDWITQTPLDIAEILLKVALNTIHLKQPTNIYTHCEVYSIQHYVIKFVSDLRQVKRNLKWQLENWKNEINNEIRKSKKMK
jgi:hypothetical protein